MEPKIANADRLAVFHLPGGYAGTLLGNIESAGRMQYHYVMVIFGPDKEISFFTASEWNEFSYGRDTPVFGVFSKEAHASCGASGEWCDAGLFTLRSIEYLRERVSIEDSRLSEGELWALTHILKQIQSLPSDEDSEEKHYLGTALGRYDERMVEYMKGVAVNLSGQTGP